MRNPNRYRLLRNLIADRVDADLIQRNWDELLRLAASIRQGKVSASLLVGKLAAYPHYSEISLALRELGRVERTLFTLEWLQQPELRRRANAGLNKGELRNSLAKALRFYFRLNRRVQLVFMTGAMTRRARRGGENCVFTACQRKDLNLGLRHR